MIPDEANIRRWLERAGDDEPLRLDGVPMEGAPDAVRREWKRLEWVQGILGTLDHQMAPEALDALVEARETKRQRDLAMGLDSWITAVHLERHQESPGEDWIDPLIAPSKAPEFLDRIVEQRLSAIEAQLKGSKLRRQRLLWLKRGSLALSGVLLMVLVPWGRLHRTTPAAIHLIEHASLDSLRNAHPAQVRFASLSGDFGALDLSPATDGGVR